MKIPDIPSNEIARQAALERSGLLDTDAEERFDRLTRMARYAFDAPIAIVSLIDKNRQWFKSVQGLSITETPRDLSFCNHAIHYADLFIVEDALKDNRFFDNPLVTGDPFVRFYAGAPLRSSDGFRLGTLCVIDKIPRTLSDNQKKLLRELADCVEHEIEQEAASNFYRELQRKEQRTRAIIQGTRIGTWEWNVQTGETIFNERWADICGYRLEELAPVDIQTWLSLAHPDDLPESTRLLNEHFAGRSPEYDFRCRMKHKNGAWVWVHDRGQVLEWTAAGEPRMMFGTHADVTQEMKDLERIQKQNTALNILNELALEPETNENTGIQKALQLATQYLNLPLGIVSEIISDTYSVRWFVAPEDAGLHEKSRFALEDTFCSLLLAEEGSLAISHMGESRFREHRCYEMFGLESYIAAPVYVGGELFGTLNFSSPTPHDASFSDTDTTFVVLLARWIGGVLERKRSNEMLTKLVDQTPGMLYQYRLWPDGHGAFPFSSPHIREIYGVESEDVREDAAEAFSRIHPEDLIALADSIDRSAKTLSTWQFQYRVKNGASGWRWVEGKASPEAMPDKSIIWYGYIADIDDSKRTEIALHESENQLRRLYELSPIGIALSDYRTGNFLDVNEALRAPTGFSQQTLIKAGFKGLMPEGMASIQKRIMAELTTEGRYGPYEVSIQRADKSTYPAIIQGMRINDANEQPLVWTLVEDITERKKVDRMKNEFISTVSHELRTPLTSISGSLGLITGGALGKVPAEMSKMISIAQKNSENLRRLVDDLLDMEKLVSGTMTMNISPAPVLPLIREVVEQLRTYAVQRSVSVLIAESRADAVVNVDPARLHQALANLLSNAVKFSPDSGTVTVGLQSKGDRLRISVSDHGPGVPESFRAHIFQKFAQADGSSTRSQGGTGLGLAITKEIVTQMGGSTDFESEEGQGATFWLELPMKASQQGHL
jgi:PAS domain S-box-containing protein